MYLTWAYNSHDDRINQRHTERGTSHVTYVMVDPVVKPVVKPFVKPVVKPIVPVPLVPKPAVPVKKAHHPNLVSFDGGKFLVSWVYDSKSKKITFQLEVQTTGWVGFGLAPKAPNNMLHYDVVVGGVINDKRPISYLYVSKQYFLISSPR